MSQKIDEALSGLNEYQLAAVINSDPVCLVNANVGSGKTRVLVTKAAYLHDKGIPYENMMILTFTNKAADELKQRLLPEETEMPLLGTFHHAAMVLMKEYLDVTFVGFTKEFEVILPEDELALAEEVILQNKLKIKYKNRLQKRLSTERKPKYKDDLPILRRLLAEEKKKRNVMSYDDLLHFAIDLIKESEPVLPLSYILVDEVQDCDEQQLVFLQTLMEKYRPCLFAVGDPSQSIYSFRAGHIQVFYRLKSMYQAVELNLPVNYRSNASILEAAKYFQQNGNPLIGVDKSTERIRIKNHYDPLAESIYLADELRVLHDEGTPWEEIAVFARLVSQLDILNDTFERENIPVNVMTLHASKGLEFDCVFIIGVNDGLLPIAGGYDQEEEERRLFYVGMTRARKRLEISYYTNPGMPGVFGGEGRFIRSIPPKLTERDTPEKPAVSMQELKRLVEEEKKNKKIDSGEAEETEGKEDEVTADTDTHRRVSHPKYGAGTVVSEDDMMIHVNFDAYGEKSFLKMLSELTDL